MAILLHATRATHDVPHIGVRKGERMYHVLSDLPGRQGSEELRTFVRGCGMRPEWVQYRGSYREHFDAHGHLVECLRLRGARVVGNHELGLLLRAKRDPAYGAPAVETAPQAVPSAERTDSVTDEEGEGDFRWGPVAGVPTERQLRALGAVDGRDVLELGCGSGARALTVIGWGGRYTGVDEDVRWVEAARRRLAEAGAGGRVLLDTSADLAPLGDATFDVVFNVDGALDHAPHLPLALAAIARVLRPGGRCALMALSPFFGGFPLGGPGERSLVPVRSYFDRAPRHEAGARRLRFHRTVGDWIAAFASAGLILTDALELEPHPREWQPGRGPQQPRWEQVAMLPYTVIWRADKPA